jgi:hypothetical protein
MTRDEMLKEIEEYLLLPEKIRIQKEKMMSSGRKFHEVIGDEDDAEYGRLIHRVTVIEGKYGGILSELGIEFDGYDCSSLVDFMSFTYELFKRTERQP